MNIVSQMLCNTMSCHSHTFLATFGLGDIAWRDQGDKSLNQCGFIVSRVKLIPVRNTSICTFTQNVYDVNHKNGSEKGILKIMEFFAGGQWVKNEITAATVLCN